MIDLDERILHNLIWMRQLVLYGGKPAEEWDAKIEKQRQVILAKKQHKADNSSHEMPEMRKD